MIETTTTRLATQWDESAIYYEYTQAASPHLPPVPCRKYPATLHQSGESRVIPFDCSDILETPSPATSPNILANYIRLAAGQSIQSHTQACAQLFFAIRGNGKTHTQWGTLEWQERDVFVLPYGSEITHQAEADSALYWVHDGPLFEYLGAVPHQARFEPTHYPWAKIQAELAFYNSQPGAHQRNRNAIILGNKNTQATMSASPTIWATIVYVEPGVVQRPHRHNSVAVDIVVQAEQNVYTLVGKALDEHHEIIRPERVDWESGAAFITPPALWHGHYNDSDQPAIIMAVQEASLYEHMRTLDIQFT